MALDQPQSDGPKLKTIALTVVVIVTLVAVALFCPLPFTP